MVFGRIGFSLFFDRINWFWFIGLFPKKEEVDRYWISWVLVFQDLDKFLGRFLDIGQIDAISINFWIKSISALLICIEQNCPFLLRHYLRKN